MRIYEEKIAGYRNFNNKLWNIARYIEGKVDKEAVLADPKPQFSADHWILNRLDTATKQATKMLDNYELGQAFDILYHFIWDDFADWYLEASKTQLNTSVLTYVLEVVLKLAHPFAPYVTETIWDTVDWEKGLLISAKWPQTKGFDKKQAAEFEELIEIIKEIRHLRAEMGATDNNLYYIEADFIAKNGDLIAALGGLKGVQQVSSAWWSRRAVVADT